MPRKTKAEKAARSRNKRPKTYESHILVATHRATGSKRKGKRMKREPITYRNATLVRSDIDAALDIDADTLAYMNGAGRVKRLDYRREG